MSYTRPSAYPDFCLTGTRSAPPGGEINTGYLPDQIPPCEEHNFLFGTTGDWIRWLDQITYPTTKVVTAGATESAQSQTILGNPSGGVFTRTLPPSAGNLGTVIKFKNINYTNTTAFNIAVNSGDSLENVLNGTASLGQGEILSFAADGVGGWWQV